MRWAITTTLLLLLYVIVLGIHFCYAHAAPWTAFQAVSDGMKRDQVRRMLGTPGFIRHDTTPQREVFFYGGFLEIRFCTMEIYFDTNGLVTGKFHDH